MSKLFPEVHAPDLVDVEFDPPAYERVPDWHSVITIKLGELVDMGWLKWYTVDEEGGKEVNPDWKWDYLDEEQYFRLCDKINARFWNDEISMVPPGIWKQQLIRKLNEVMPKYKPLYKAIANGFDPLQDGNAYGKSRQIYSEFPETLLSGNSDYVSSGNDREYEDVHQGALVDMEEAYARRYNDVDVWVLEELECMFTCLYTANVNGY